jgi:formate/nitrite transporter
MAGFLSPCEICQKVEETAKQKASLPMRSLIVLGILAGVYIGFGAELSTMVTHDLAKYMGVGFSKFIAGSVFSVGLMLVVIGGAELFTGNCLMLGCRMQRNIKTGGLLRNWSIVYLANFAGSLLLVAIMYYSGLWKLGQLGVGAEALKIANAKVNLPFVEALCRGIGCNWLVCLAVWLAVAGQDIGGKILGIYFPIMAFVASGFEHSIANMYFIPMGLMLKTNQAVVTAAGLSGKLAGLTWSSFLLHNLLPVTIGNIVGGGLFVAGAYCLAFRQHKN